MLLLLALFRTPSLIPLKLPPIFTSLIIGPQGGQKGILSSARQNCLSINLIVPWSNYCQLFAHLTH